MKRPGWIFALCAAAVVTACTRHGESAPAADSVTLSGDTLNFSRRAPGEPGEQEKLITVAKVSNVRSYVRQFPGRLVWNEDRTVRVSSPFSGRVTRIHVQAGDSVTAGARLVTLSSPDIGAAQADATKAEADFTLAAKALRRARDLQAAGVMATRDVEQADADYAHAVAERDRAARRLEPYGATAAVDGQFVVRSPVAGVVVERAVNPGQEVRPDQSAPLFIISDPSSLWLQVELPEDSAAATRVGQSLTVRRSYDPSVAHTAKVVSVAETVDPLTRTLRTRAVLGNTDRVLKAEQFVSVEVIMTADPVPVVPAAAVFLVGDRQYLWVADGHGAYMRREVRPDREDGGQVAIPTGLLPDDLVVTNGAIFLQELAANAVRG